jgi:hypothetical protein
VELSIFFFQSQSSQSSQRVNPRGSSKSKLTGVQSRLGLGGVSVVVVLGRYLSSQLHQLTTHPTGNYPLRPTMALRQLGK